MAINKLCETVVLPSIEMWKSGERYFPNVFRTATRYSIVPERWGISRVFAATAASKPIPTPLANKRFDWLRLSLFAPQATLPTSMLFDLPARIISKAAAVDLGIPIDFAKSFPEPDGRIASVRFVPMSPLTTSLMVPSPPTATHTSESTDLAISEASPGPDVSMIWYSLGQPVRRPGNSFNVRVPAART